MPILFLVLALAGFFIHFGFQKKRPRKTIELLLLYLVFFAFGWNRIADFVAHIFFSQETAELIGWGAGSPFQFEVGIANLAFGVLAILSFWMRRSFLFAAVLGNVIWLWGDAIGHIRNMLLTNNFAPGNMGVYFWADIFMPIIIGVVYILRERNTN